MNKAYFGTRGDTFRGRGCQTHQLVVAKLGAVLPVHIMPLRSLLQFGAVHRMGELYAKGGGGMDGMKIRMDLTQARYIV